MERIEAWAIELAMSNSWQSDLNVSAERARDV